jgi:hypothetical protein
MGVALGAKIDIAAPFQGAEIFAHVLGIGIAADHGRDHEGAVDDFAETELLDD